jgi:hypothetical protein
VSQSIRTSRVTAVLSVRVASHATSCSKSREPGPRPGKRDTLDEDAVHRALDPSQPGTHFKPPDTQVAIFF